MWTPSLIAPSTLGNRATSGMPRSRASFAASAAAFGLRRDTPGIEATGARFLALAADDTTLDALSSADEPIGMPVHARRADRHNTVEVSRP